MINKNIPDYNDIWFIMVDGDWWCLSHWSRDIKVLILAVDEFTKIANVQKIRFD